MELITRQKPKGSPPVMTLDGPDDDIIEALRGAPAASARFTALPPSHQNEYLKWINEAKKPPTRARRIASMIEKLGKT